jgi:hypothetical protein
MIDRGTPAATPQEQNLLDKDQLRLYHLNEQATDSLSNPEVSIVLLIKISPEN